MQMYMCVCMCNMYVCIYIYIHVYMCVYIYICGVCVYARMHACMHAGKRADQDGAR